jgi:flavin-dependent dehydrogenase
MGIDCLVLDSQPFPRHKLCGGWITPQVLQDLALDPGDYPHSFLTFQQLQIHLPIFGLPMRTIQYSIRRYEFDTWLLQRSGATVSTHNVKHVQQLNNTYVIDDNYRCRYLVGAGGTRCPVYKQLFRQRYPRNGRLQVVAQELEFPYQWEDDRCHLWFFQQGLPGYAWYVPKANGYLNVGVGAMSRRLKQRQDHIQRHWQHLAASLAKAGHVHGAMPDPGGYSYYLRADTDISRIDNAFVIGDAAGLATRDMCEGIGPAVRSGLLAANAIANGEPYSLTSVDRYSGKNRWIRRGLEYLFS